MLWKDLIQSEYFKIALGLDMDTHIVKNETIKIEKIVSNGQKSPQNFWYEQEKNEFVLVLEGFAIVEFEDFEVELKKGDCLNIKAYQKHRVKFTSLDETTIWFAVFY